MPKRKAKNGDAPVTQHDLSLLAGEMTRRFNLIDKRFSAVDDRFESVDDRFNSIDNRLDDMQADLTGLRRGQEAILGVMSSIDLQLRELKSLPIRVARLEHSRR